VLGASTLEEEGWVDESRLEEPRTEEADIKTKNGGGKTRKTNTLGNETKEEDQCRCCQQNTWNKGRTLMLFGDEQPLERGSVTCLERYFHGNNYNGNCRVPTVTNRNNGLSVE
jgi:hypothetical protein